MAKQIKGTDIIEQGHLREAVEQANLLKIAYNDLDKQVKATSASLKGVVGGVKGKTAGEIKLITDAYKESNVALKAAIQLERDQAKLAKETAAAEREALKLANEKARAAERQQKVNEKLNSEYAQQSKRLNDLRKQYKDLILVQGKETAETQKLLKEISQLDAKLKKVDATVGQHQRNVGNYVGAVNHLTGALGQLGLAFSVFSVMRDAFNIVKQSEDAFASLSAITGLTGEKFGVFKDAILTTANELKVSGTVVAEAAEKIASAQPALLENADALAAVTKEAITLNKAIKGDLTETSMALVGVMNQFSLGAEDANRIINILAAGSQAGAATVNQINESMVKFGTTAKLMNISVEESVGLIETLGEKAIFGSDAGTALRNILLKMGSIDVLPEKALKQLEKYGVDTSIVKDTSLSLEERLKELSKVAKDSTAIMQIFGTENATAATVLLNSLGTYDKMTNAVTGTNVATEQAAINSDTLSAVIGELRAAWENLVIKWSEGTDVAGGLKSILRFIADNLETIVTWVFNGVKAWVAYKSVLTLVNKEGKGLIQVLINLKKTGSTAGLSLQTIGKGLMGIGGILLTVLPLLWDMGKAIWEMFDRTTALEKATEKYNEKIIEERAEMDKLRFAIQTTTAGSKERQKVIDEINARYGTTLQNIQDETLFMNQLWEAYQKVNAEMEKRIMQGILEEELTQLLKAKRGFEQALTKTEDTWWDANQRDLLNKGLDETNAQIAELQAELFKLNQQGGATRKNLSSQVSGHERVTQEIKKEQEAVKDLRTEMEKMDVDRIYRQNERLQGVDVSQFDPKDNPFVQGMILANEAIIKAEQEAMERRRRMAQETIDLMKKITDALIAEIDKRIAAEEEELSESEKREDYLRELAAQGNTDAAAALKAEQVAQAKQELKIEELERKKRNLLVLTTGLESVSQKINSGDTNAFNNTAQELANFIAKLPKFYEGTETTVAAALGRPHMSGKDGYLVRVDGSEKVLNPEQSAMTGSMTTDEITAAALMYKNNQMLAGRVMGYKSTSSDKVVSKLNDVEKAIKSIDIPEHQFNFNEQSNMALHAIKYKDRLVRNHYKNGGLFK